MKRLFLVGAIVSLVALGAVPAQAHVQFVQISSRGFLLTNGTVEVLFAIQCPSGEGFLVQGIRVRQGSLASGSLGIIDSCDGVVQTYTIPLSDPGLSPGEARARAAIATSDNDVVFYSRTIRLVECPPHCPP